jgi:hypothetical protein
MPDAAGMPEIRDDGITANRVPKPVRGGNFEG